jgi:hypothetical protein
VSFYNAATEAPIRENGQGFPYKACRLTRFGRSRRASHEVVYSDDAEFTACQRDAGNGRWQTISSWTIPSAGQH